MSESALTPPDPFLERAVGDLQNRVKWLEEALGKMCEAYQELSDDHDRVVSRVRAIERTIPRKAPPKRSGRVSGPVRRVAPTETGND